MQAKKTRRKELESLYSDSERQQNFFKFLESPKTTCPARSFLFWLDCEALRLQRRLARSGAVKMTPANYLAVTQQIFNKYVAVGAAFPIFMPNAVRLDITMAMEKFEADVAAQLVAVSVQLHEKVAAARERLLVHFVAERVGDGVELTRDGGGGHLTG